MSEVIEILKLGLPGLVFLLAGFSYRLLAKEQEKDNPSPEVLKSIKYFASINVVLALLTIASPIIDNTYFSNSEVLNLDAETSNTDLDQGTAAVCHDVNYANRYLLVKDNTTGKLIQVFAGSLVPCTEEPHIIINAEDAVNLGWSETVSKSEVEVVAALPGYKFII